MAANQKKRSSRMILLRSGIGLVAATIAISGCAAFRGTRPHDMTGAGHERAAEKAEAKGHTELAGAHRGAGQQLEEAERNACRDVPRGDIAPALTGLSLGAVREIKLSGGDTPPTTVGASVPVALQGRSLESMGKLINCRAARGALHGGDADPFAVKGASVRVSPGDAGWATVRIEAIDGLGGQEIVRRIRDRSRWR
jgi:hypothetical protein